MAYSGVLAAAGLSVGGLAAAATTGPDYTGIALLVSAVAAVIGALTGLVTALRRKPEPPPPQVDVVAELLRDLRDRMDEDKP